MKDKLKKELYSKLNEIRDELFNNEKDSNKIGLMGGTLGEILFFLNYSKFSDNDVYLEYALTLLREELKTLSNYSYTFAGGYSGLGWLLEYINENNFVKIDTNEVLGDVDKLVHMKMFQDIHRGNYDYLHGAIGGGVYFLHRKKSPLRKQSIKRLLNEIEKISIPERDSLKWNFYNFEEQKIEFGNYNLGVSHGIPSIIYFLLEVHKDKTLLMNTEVLINKSVKFILDNELMNNCGCYFPNSIGNGTDKTKSRLAWCYGDLGLSCILLQIGKHFNNHEILNKVKDIMDFSCSRKSLEGNMVYDAGLCHGSSGVAHIFNVMHEFFGNENYLKTSIFWYEKTIEFARFKNGLAGYKSFNPIIEQKYINDRGFLEGISGIGLSIMSFLSKEKMSWDEALLIS